MIPAMPIRWIVTSPYQPTTGVPFVILTTMYKHRDEVRKLGDALTEHDAEHKTFTFVHEHAALATVGSEAAVSEAATSSDAPSKQLRPSMATRSVDLLWLSSKIDKFRSRSWWAGSFLIGMRIAQTSIMVFISNAGLQATAASLVALIGIAVQTHAAPYRRTSDNHSALAAAWLLFMWPFVLLVRYSETVDGEYGVVLGALLIAATVATVAFVACALAMDVWEDAMADNTEHRTTTVTEEEAGPADESQSTTELAAGDVEMTALSSTEQHTGRPSPSNADEVNAAPASSEDANFLLGMLCVVGQTQSDDAASATTAEQAASC